ncbi:MAG: DUF2497 domain-containing protein [Lactobacillus sp.]|jgi:cell pole-organizing protein PopZ|nr:DUF2497 domain-containing protein [Lactobacillus sp.]
MADNPQQELSMEEILSSIRNILADGDSISEQAEEDIEDLSFGDSVFDLSKEMMVEERAPIEYAPIVEAAEVIDIDPISDLDSLIGGADISIDDIKLDIDDDILSTPIAANDTNKETPIAPITSHDEIIITEGEDDALISGLEDDLQIDLVASSSEYVEENIQDEIVDAEETDLEEVLQIQMEQDTIGIPDDSIVEELEEGMDEALMPSFGDIKVDTTSEPIYEAEDESAITEAPVLEPMPELEPITELEPDPIVLEEDISVKEPAPQTYVSEPVHSDTLTHDASEKILNKFSQIFEEDRQRRIIEDVAREEIAEKTQVWLDKNLKNIVVELVQKEVERVMAKVGK